MKAGLTTPRTTSAHWGFGPSVWLLDDAKRIAGIAEGEHPYLGVVDLSTTRHKLFALEEVDIGFRLELHGDPLIIDRGYASVDEAMKAARAAAKRLTWLREVEAIFVDHSDEIDPLCRSGRCAAPRVAVDLLP